MMKCDVCHQDSEAWIDAHHITTNTDGKICQQCYIKYDTWILSKIEELVKNND